MGNRGKSKCCLSSLGRNFLTSDISKVTTEYHIPAGHKDACGVSH